MDVSRSICCNELKKADVYDSSGEKIGRIRDLTFKLENDELKLSQFILAGPRLEELLEAMRLKPDRDPVFDASLIEKMGDKVVLNTTVNSLKTTLDDDAIPPSEFTLSKFEKLDIVDKNGVKVGRAIDIDFNVDNSASVIVGGGMIEETLEALGLKSDVDIIVPSNSIESIGDQIRLKVSKEDLSTTMKEALTSPEVKKARESRDVHESVTKVRLFSHRPF